MISMGDDPTLERPFRGHKDAVTSVVFNPNMKQAISGSLDGAIMMWNFKPHLRAFRKSDHTGPVLSVAVSKTGGIIASGSKDRTIRLWRPNVCKNQSTVIKAHTGGVRRVAFSADSCSLLSASDDKTIKVWGVAGQKFKQTLSGHSNWVRAAAFNSTGDMIVSGSDDKTVRLWDLSQRACIHAFHDHTGPVNDVLFHPDGVCVAACSSDSTINIWDLRTHQLLQHYAAHDESVNSIDIHPLGDYMISASSDTSTKIWDLREGHICYTLQGHDSKVNSVAFSPLGDFFASASSDETILVWKSNFDKPHADMTSTTVAPGPPPPLTKSHRSYDAHGGAPPPPRFTEHACRLPLYQDETPPWPARKHDAAGQERPVTAGLSPSTHKANSARAPQARAVPPRVPPARRVCDAPAMGWQGSATERRRQGTEGVLEAVKVMQERLGLVEARLSLLPSPS